MSIRAIHRAAGTTGLRATSRHSLDIVADSDDSDLLKYKDSAGTVRTLINGSQAQTLTGKTLVSPLGVVVALEGLLTQVAGNKTHTLSFPLPAGATLLDILITGTAVWDSGTTATLKAGINGGDDDGFFTGLDLKTIPAAGKTINFAHPGNAAGAAIPEIDGGAGNTQLGATGAFLYNATAKTVDVIVTDVNAAGVAGRTRVTVLYSLPAAQVAPVVT